MGLWPGRSRIWRAPAKVNLTLHILGRRADGWHDLDSVVAFAGCGDWLSFEPAETLSLEVDGPMAAAAGAIGDNLIMRAARALQDRSPGIRLGRFHLRKNLPVAAGLGGGSSDAAAALRALAHENALAADDPHLWAAAQATGSDVPVCLDPQSRTMSGRGEKLGPRLQLPPLFAVLANPRVAVATPAVFARLGLAKGASSGLGASPLPGAGADRSAATSALRQGRNDMQAAACALEPAISEVLEALGALPGVSLARMSGSGATCFALFDQRAAASRAAASLARAHPGWWVKTTVLR
ncbi:4-(cytidine 5'-diphospho)-2-C-methyl-D-erythritol kinase [Methylocapsa sp. S129]|uniref:4-(cytidine 5'-diphospho)-2-C-methyl-D-erythritol kinase n=1 Tax=Methylocapsa sp. S129 TaxID=1641869 RepID=UPI00131A632D|nr:4-(cytidine 5'-diphospho)-2-C-methyl-D-erythritol kinase [Methylocapsa sp. S129]